ncbi:MAG: hypothetical protein LBV51_02075 [Acholeplasmatales bacterium]|jgi:maltose alpha-D-glucosyltransferase/alpha-amylase|nr:hypothetical protein [Acholeplasmatales bacterium]
MKEWLKNAVFYEIYPSSFNDSNKDGYGDLIGIIKKLDYLENLGINAIWLNPIFDSAFMDGGYDVRDFFKVSKRFGSMEDFELLISESKKRNINIVLDLVAGHTSEKNPLFIKSASPKKNKYSQMFIWNDNPWELTEGYKFISGRYNRMGCYLVNFFSTQPALNYGFNEITHPSWQLSYTHPACLQTREYLKNVIRFWLDKGVMGFRVDMADSLVKNDPAKEATILLWNDITSFMCKEYPEAILISEWSSVLASKAGFDCDFLLDHHNNPYNQLVRAEEASKISVFNINGKGDYKKFFNDYISWYNQIKDTSCLIGNITCNHDTPRLSPFYNNEQLKIIYTMIITLPGVPFIYYGDEIGIKYEKDMISKECGYYRTGTRTPMKWDNSFNYGFSESKKIFLPQDSGVYSNVLTATNDENSILNAIKKIIKFKKENEDFNKNLIEYIDTPDFPFIYKVGSFYIIVNPTNEKKEFDLGYLLDELFSVNNRLEYANNKYYIASVSLSIVKIK